MSFVLCPREWCKSQMVHISVPHALSLGPSLQLPGSTPLSAPLLYRPPEQRPFTIGLSSVSDVYAPRRGSFGQALEL